MGILCKFEQLSILTVDLYFSVLFNTYLKEFLWTLVSTLKYCFLNLFQGKGEEERWRYFFDISNDGNEDFENNLRKFLSNFAKDILIWVHMLKKYYFK